MGLLQAYTFEVVTIVLVSFSKFQKIYRYRHVMNSELGEVLESRDRQENRTCIFTSNYRTAH